MAALSDEIVALWQITESELIADTNSSRIYRCRSALHSLSLIVKDLKPTGLWEAKGFDFLDWRQGHGAVRLLDRIGNCGLIEDAGSIMLSQFHAEKGDLAANEIILGVVNQLHAVGDAIVPSSLISIRDHFDSLFKTALTIGDPKLSANLRWAADLTDRLIASQFEIRPLHGDIHHENIVSADGKNWRAIDPQGLIGDPAYDVANVFGSPLNARTLILNFERINALADLFASGLHVHRDRILGFAAAHAGVSVCWSIRDNATLENDTEMNERFELLQFLRTMIDG